MKSLPIAVLAAIGLATCAFGSLREAGQAAHGHCRGPGPGRLMACWPGRRPWNRRWLKAPFLRHGACALPAWETTPWTPPASPAEEAFR
jgi:hypothetical protein